MWIYTINGFYSIVRDNQNKNRYHIRCRNKKEFLDLMDMLVDITEDMRMTPTIQSPPDSEYVMYVDTNPIADYQYRAIVSMDILQEFLALQSNIEYTNFKDAVSKTNNPDYLKVCMDVYAVTFDNYMREKYPYPNTLTDKEIKNAIEG